MRKGRRKWVAIPGYEPNREEVEEGPHDPRIVLLLSGGLDSVTVLGHLDTWQGWEIITLFVDYGQAELRYEQSSAAWFSAMAGATHIDATVKLPGLSSVGWIEGRNAWLLGLATSVALIHDARYIYSGFASNNLHLDQNHSFVRKFEKLIPYLREAGSKQKIQIIDPMRNATRAEVLKEGYELWGEDIGRVVYCRELTGLRPCGRCDGCVGTLRALHELSDGGLVVPGFDELRAVELKQP